MVEKLLDVKNLSTYFYTEEGVVYALDDVSFSLEKGETLGIVGESGSGKSVTALSIMRLVQSPPGRIVDGKILLEGDNILLKSKEEMQDIRGNKMAMIFQEPMTALNPVLTIGYQIMESLLIHQNVNKNEARVKAIDMLRKVGIPNPEKRIDDYPHQLSGGMRQRAMIAIALCCNPSLLICDEPTTALDVTIQAQILDLINRLKEDMDTAVIMITHDLGVVAQISDNVLVMYAGKEMEYGSVREVFTDPKHPYTEALLASIPTVENKQDRLHVIDGMVPSLSNLPQGCLFHTRCGKCMEICRVEKPRITYLNGNRQVRCWLYEERGGGNSAG
ncbi:ABC transporter ATP-binding protein [Anaerosphaera multitolerans]|uniref:ABC transporter ATP-binding protein n=1 Tax=Anaerosphaera multitolerans TaxID=2487351 RepID=A0A437S674_9FIRM|nr:ABC transporter ATP-binding protein [Anaerosphaera multitolerans]RVU54406.1 ABC transporter ATP-binding protein [Anaerosphaera multitolerans]